MSNSHSAFNRPSKPELNHNWPLTEMRNINRPDVPQAAKQAMEHVFRARSAKCRGEIEKSLHEYKQAMVLLFEADTEQPDHWTQILRYTNMEYALLLLGR